MSGTKSKVGISADICPTLTAESEQTKCVPVVIYDARGNGEGGICPTLTGDHQNRVTDYTAIVVRKDGNHA